MRSKGKLDECCVEKERNRKENIFLHSSRTLPNLIPLSTRNEDSSSPSWLSTQPSSCYSLSVRSVSLKMGYMRSGREIFHRQ